MGRVASCLAFLLVAGMLCGCGPSSTGAGEGRPDLLLITLDTTRADRIGAYGYAAAHTPEIDALSAGSVRFEQAFAPVPATLPSHASLLTGLYPASHGARVNGSFSLDPDATTLAEHLAASGYRTAAFVGAFPLESRFGLDRGFELYDDRLPPRDRGMTYAERPGEQVTDAALEWVRGAADEPRPLFVWVHYFDPHAPYQAPDGSVGYDGEIAYVDEQVGKLLRGFDAARSLSRTVVVLTADHGESLGEHGEETHSIFLYDSTLRIPLLLAYPAADALPRVVDSRIVSLVDVFPTVLALLEVGPVAGLDGRDLLAAPDDADRAVYFETLEPLARYGWAPMRGLRTLDSKFIEAPEPEFYALDQDPQELDNRFEEGGARLVSLQERLLERYGGREMLVRGLDSQEQPDLETVEQLESLGYVSTRSREVPAGRRDPKRMLPVWNRIEEFHALTRAGRPGEALELIDEIVAADPDNGRAWFFRGMLLQSLGRLEEAERSVRNSIRLAPGTDNWARLAEILYRQERFEEGDAAVAEVRRIEPDSGRAYLAEGIGAVLRGRFDEALRAFDRAGQLDPVEAGPRAAELAELTRQMR